MKVVFLVRNPLDYFASLTRRMPQTPFHNMLRWLSDHQAAAQYWQHARAHVVRYEDTSSPSISVREATFGSLFLFLGLDLTPELRSHYNNIGANTSLEDSRCYSRFVANRSATVHQLLRQCETSEPLHVNNNSWRQDTIMVARAQSMAQRVEKSSQGSLGRLAASLGYLEEDAELRHALRATHNSTKISGATRLTRVA